MQTLIASAIACLSVLPLQAQHLLSYSPSIHRDTIEVFVDNDRQIYLYHKVDVQVDEFELSEYYGVSTDDILDASRLLRQENDSLDRSAYLIPVNLEQLQKQPCQTETCVPVVYSVRPKETTFRIARRYFDLRIDQLRALNGMSNNDLSIGQKLLVGWFKPHDNVQELPDTAMVVDTVQTRDPFHPEVPEETVGIAFWNKQQSDRTNSFVLHRDARLHSEIELTNPMLGTRVLVRVIGRIPPTYTKDISVVISPAVAQRLGALDARFRVEMRFVK